MLDPTALALAGATGRRLHDLTHAESHAPRRRRRPALRLAAPAVPQLSTDQLALQC